VAGCEVRRVLVDLDRMRHLGELRQEEQRHRPEGLHVVSKKLGIV
jgi:hypothetical protein